MKNQTVSQNPDKQPQTVFQPAVSQPAIGQPAISQPVEKEYINSMLNINCSNMVRDEVPVNIVNTEESHEPVDLCFDKHADVECKVFSVAGLNLALPLSCIKAILHQQKILSGSDRRLCIGTVKNNDEDIKVIDLTYLIMNTEDDIDDRNKVVEKQVDIILLKGFSVGIIYEQELEDQIILHQHVCWRNTTSDRYWLAGTVKQKGLSLLDLEGITKLLNNKCYEK